jgi:Multicopper oxidase
VESPVGPDPNERGWKDTVRANPGEITGNLGPFGAKAAAGLPFGQSRTGEYVWHCHILDHEDNEMMDRYKVTYVTHQSQVPVTRPPTGLLPARPAGNPSDSAPPLGKPVTSKPSSIERREEVETRHSDLGDHGPRLIAHGTSTLHRGPLRRRMITLGPLPRFHGNSGDPQGLGADLLIHYGSCTGRVACEA